MQWVMFAVMAAANLAGAAYALARGNAAHRWATALIAAGVAVQCLLLQIALAQGASRASVAVMIDAVDSYLLALGFLSIAICFHDAGWAFVLLALQIAQLGVDAVIFNDDPWVTRLDFPDAANVLSVLAVMWLSLAVWRGRRVAGVVQATPARV